MAGELTEKGEMGVLRLIWGRAGTGKTGIILDELRRRAEEKRPGGYLIVDTGMIKIKATRTDINVIEIDASGIADEFGAMAYGPISMLGCLSKATGCFSRDSFEKSLYEVLPERRHKMIPGNLAAFDKGAEKV